MLAGAGGACADRGSLAPSRAAVRPRTASCANSVCFRRKFRLTNGFAQLVAESVTHTATRDRSSLSEPR
eukprot:scaffold67520_cov53-Phaeocystis_antarctica.AAC.1